MSRSLVWILILGITLFFLILFSGWDSPSISPGWCADTCMDFYKEDMSVCDVISEPYDKLTCMKYTIQHYEKCIGPVVTDENGCTGDYVLDFDKTQCPLEKK